MNTLYGRKLYVTSSATQPSKHRLPVFKVRPWISMSDAVRDDIDRFLRETFGHDRTEIVEHGREPGMYVSDFFNAIYIHPVLYDTVRRLQHMESINWREPYDPLRS